MEKATATKDVAQKKQVIKKNNVEKATDSGHIAQRKKSKLIKKNIEGFTIK